MMNLDPTGTACKLYRGWADPASVISDNERMSIVPSSALMICRGGPLSAVDADLLIVPWFPDEPSQTIREDLRRFKALMETGEVPTTKGQSRGGAE